MSRSYSPSEIAVDGVKGAATVIGVIALLLVALAGFANGYNQISPVQFTAADRFQSSPKLEQARLMDPNELVSATPTNPDPAKLSVAKPNLGAAPAELQSEPAIAAVTAVSSDIVTPVEPTPGPV